MKNFILHLLLVIFLFDIAAAIPLCLNKESPFQPNSSLNFCTATEYSQRGCCRPSDDDELASKFKSMNITDQKCADYVKQVLCAKCDSYSDDLYRDESVPALCNSTSNSSASYCSNVWDACKDTVIVDSPFSASLSGTGSPPGVNLVTQNSTLTAQWQSKQSFCDALGAPVGEGEFCFNGGPFTFVQSAEQTLPPGICLERVSEEPFLNMVPHPDGTDKAFFANQNGVVFLATIPQQGNITLDTFLDIQNVVSYAGELGLMSVAFHPDYTRNGRFFVSYNCDKNKWDQCSGTCACNSDVNCTPSQLNDTSACQYSSVISEYSSNSSLSGQEVKRIFTMGLPYTTHHGGLILFGPQDKYLYFMMGDGGSTGDPFNFAQNKKSLLGKILRIDVDKTSSDSNLWGNYGIPDDNPFVQENNSRPEIWALGFQNPWRCTFDSLKNEYFYCSDSSQTYEEINLVTKAGNYGWRVYDGLVTYTPLSSPGGNTSASTISPTFPIAWYLHDSVNKKSGSAAAIGGYLSRSSQDGCLYGRYLYADLYGSAMWTAIEHPQGSGNYTYSGINFTCSSKSPVPCEFVGGSLNIGYVFAWGEDNRKNVYILSSQGVFKIVSPSNCNYVCNKTAPSTPTTTSSPQPSPPAPSNGQRTCILNFDSMVYLAIVVLLIVRR